MRKIKEGMTEVQESLAVSEGNHGATLLCAILDHDNRHQYIRQMDELGIHGSRVYMLASDVCKQDSKKFFALLDAVRDGRVSNDDLNYAIDNWGKGIDWDTI